MPKERRWRTKEGKKIPVSAMTDGHLLNSIALLERTYRGVMSRSFSFAATLSGEMATYYADQECDIIVDAGPDYLFPVDWPFARFSDLEEERKRRGLERREP